MIRQFGACRREDRCTGKRTTAVIRADGTLLDFIDPFDADTDLDELLKRLADVAAAAHAEPGAHMDGLERVRRAARRRRACCAATAPSTTRASVRARDGLAGGTAPARRPI